jgi:hypothetical protein
MTYAESHGNIPINDYSTNIEWQNNSRSVKLDCIQYGMSVLSRIKPPCNSCCWGNVVNSNLLTTVIHEIIHIAGSHFLNGPYEVITHEFKFIKPLYVDKTITAEGKISEQEKGSRNIIEAFLYNEADELCVVSSALLLLNR